MAPLNMCSHMNFMSSCGLILVLYMITTSSIESEAKANLSSVDFSYPTFESPEGIETLGHATFENSTLQLTQGRLPHSVGRAVRSEAVKIWDRSTGDTLSFTTTFTFSVQILNLTNYGDGLTFGLFADKLIPANSDGRYLGLYDPDSTVINNVVAVEFDLFQNQFDPDSNHVGLDLNNVSSATTSLLINYGIRLKAGNLINVKIEYDGFGGRLNVYAINASLGNPDFRNLVLSSELNVSRIIQKEEVFVGFSAATGLYGEYHTIHSWSFQTWSGRSPSQRRATILGATLGAFVFLAGLIVARVLYRRSRKRRKRPFLSVSQDLRSNPTSDLSKEIIKACDWDVFPRKFSYEELSRATNDFDPKELLGEGGFGDVYKGIIPCGERSSRSIAVKRFSQSSNQSDREYLSEVAVIGRLRHRNLVQLQGWCHDHGELLLVYDYMPNGSVDQLLYEPKLSADLDWSKRLKICRGLAGALLYLHEECHHRVVHRDVKTSNVMVDSDYEARLGDFGLARFVENHNYAASLTMTSIGGGTLGYIAPERSITGKATLESDVFSYGAVLLEIACGRRPIDINSKDPEESVLVDWVWSLAKEDRLLYAADPRLGSAYDMEEMKRVLTVGLLCSSPDPLERPSIRQALRFLNYEAVLPALPTEKPMPFRGNTVSGFEAWEHGKIELHSPWNDDNKKHGDEEEGGGKTHSDVSTTEVISLKSLSSNQHSVERYF